MQFTPDQISTIIGIIGAVVTAILTAIGVNTAARAYATRVNANTQRDNAIAAAEVQRKNAETALLEAQTKAKLAEIQADKDRAAAEIAATLAKVNADAFTDMRQTILQLNEKVVGLQNQVLELQTSFNVQALESQKNNTLLGERNAEIVGLKETIEKLRDQLTKYIEKTMRKDSEEAPPEDKQLLKDTKIDAAAADKEKETSGTPPAEPVAAPITTDSTQGETSS